MTVSGIIALLVGTLMPVLGRARESANRASCMSNMRQLALGFLNYAQDNKGRLPRPSQNIIYCEDDWIYYQTGRDPTRGKLVPYCGVPDPARGSVGVYRCPSDLPDEHQWIWKDPNTNQQFKYRFSYSVNFLMCKLSGTGKPSLRVNQIRLPAQKILLVDESSNTIDDGCWAWQPELGKDGNLLSIRHDRRCEADNDKTTGRGNAAFCDGHVEFFRRADSFLPKYYDPSFPREGS